MENKHSGNSSFEGFVELTADQFNILPNDVVPVKDYEVNPKFPNCCGFHESIVKRAEEFYANFPNCCDVHRGLSEKPWFKKELYSGLDKAIVSKYSYAEYVLCNRIQNNDWYEDITHYLEYVNDSFGQPSVGAHIYLAALINYLRTSNFQEFDDRRKKLLDYLEQLHTPHEGEVNVDVNLILSSYKRWLDVFPFEISQFRNLKQKFVKTLPLLDGEPVVNPYTGMAKARLTTLPKLIEFLTALTKHLLTSVNSVELFNNGLISDVEQRNLELINESHRINQMYVLGDFTNSEQNYVRIISIWLSNEKDYYRDISPYLLKTAERPLANSNEILNKHLIDYGFFALPRVKGLAKPAQIKLVDLILNNSLPYKIAMFDRVGFVEHLIDNHTKTKKALDALWSQVLNTTTRIIKGNIAVLNPKSTENRERYTSHRHKEQVEIDYQNLK